LKCSGCGAILKYFAELPDSPFYYLELHRRLSGKCPECKRQLPKPDDFVNTMQVEVKPNPATLRKSPLALAFHHDYHKEKIP